MLAISLLFELIIQIQYAKHHQYQILDMLSYIAMLAPRNAYLCFFYACILGLCLGFYHLHKTNEWRAALALCLNKQKFFKSLAKQILALSLLALILGEGIGPHADLKAKSLRHQIQHGYPIWAINPDIWWKDKNIIAHII